jgi:small subunit ribosomal protein S20
MPNLSASKKSMRQSLKARERNYKTRADLKKVIKDTLKLAKAGEMNRVSEGLPQAFSVIDTAVKKRIIHKNNAAHKKARLAALVASK